MHLAENSSVCRVCRVNTRPCETLREPLMLRLNTGVHAAHRVKLLEPDTEADVTHEFILSQDKDSVCSSKHFSDPKHTFSNIMVQTRHAARNEATVLRQDGQDSLALRNTSSETAKPGLPWPGLPASPRQWCVPEGMSRALYLNKIPRKTPGHRRAPLLYT